MCGSESGAGRPWHEHPQSSGSPELYRCSMYIIKLTKALLQTSQDPTLQKQEKGEHYGEVEAGDHRRTEWRGNSAGVAGKEQAGEESQEHAHRKGRGWSHLDVLMLYFLLFCKWM